MSDQPAAGGLAPPGGVGSAGGDGGAGVLPDGVAALDQNDAGGGGGAVGRIRINANSAPTLDGLVSPTQSSSAFTTGSLPIVSG